MQVKFISTTPGKSPRPLRKLVALIVMVAMAGLALMFSAVLLAVIVIVGAIAGVYLWWKTREVRKLMRELARNGMTRDTKASNDDIFEGEVISVVDPKEV